MADAKVLRVPVTVRALVQRINRKALRSGFKFCAARGAQRALLGDYYILNLTGPRPRLDRCSIDIEEWARSLKVLKPWESVSREE
jgi:hypothetical protein